MLLCRDQFAWNFNLVVDNGHWLLTGRLALQATDVRSKYRFGKRNIFHCNWIVIDCIHANHRFEIADRWCSDRVVQFTCLFCTLELTWCVERFVLFERIDKLPLFLIGFGNFWCKLVESRLSSRELNNLVRTMYQECVFLSCVSSDSVTICHFSIGKDIRHGCGREPYVSPVFHMCFQVRMKNSGVCAQIQSLVGFPDIRDQIRITKDRCGRLCVQ